MAKKKIYTYFSSLTAGFHFSIVLLFIASIFLIFLSQKLKLYTASFFCLVWIQQKMSKGCLLTRLEGYFLKKGGKECDDVFFFNRFAHNLLKKKFHLTLSQIKTLFQGMLLFFFIISMVIIISHFY